MEVAGRKCVVITGPESTGKTTIAIFLAKCFKGAYNPEYAREYIRNLDRPYGYDDILKIGLQQQAELEKLLESKLPAPIFMDTYLIITKVWFVKFSGNYPTWLDDKIAETRNNTLYLLCAPDIEWVPDDVRENGGIDRIRLFKDYENELNSFDLNYKVVTGVGEARNSKAEKYVFEYLQEL